MADRSGDKELPDLSSGLPTGNLADGATLTGRLGDTTVLLYREGDTVHAFDATCPHLGGPLGEGLVADATVRCPWHHACFDLCTGKALSAPAFDSLQRYDVDVRGGSWVIGKKVTSSALPNPLPGGRAGDPAMVIVGGGAAGFAAAHALRAAGWSSDIVLFSADPHAPYDRTLLTKDYLDGKFGDERLPIAGHSLKSLSVRLELSTPVETIDVARRVVNLGDGRIQRFSKLLIATGAAPRKPKVPGINLPHVHLLRSLDDCRGVLAGAATARKIVVLGGSFIGLEAAASLRTRGYDVDVVTPELHPMEKTFGRALSDLIVDTHEVNGTIFHLGRNVDEIGIGSLRLDDGTRLPADLIICGIGVDPRVELAAAAGLTIDNGVCVDQYLRTSAPHVFAAGDIARWPDPHSGERIRVEHWVVAERQGQAAAANMLGRSRAFDMVPFFWTKHFDISVRYVGHADTWDDIVIEGDLGRRDALLRFRRNGRDLAIATIGRDRAIMEAERSMAFSNPLWKVDRVPSQ